MKKKDTKIDYELCSHRQMVKKTVRGENDVPICFHTDLVTGEMTHDEIVCGQDGDISDLKISALKMVEEIKNLLRGQVEVKPKEDDVEDEIADD